MNPFVNGYKKFRTEVYAKDKARYEAMATSQKPKTLFITCADSRVVPSVITQSKAGELFQCRVVGNLVPAHGNNAGGVTSAVEYAVMVLGVEHVVVCGHSDCGAMRAFSHPEKLESLHAVRSWISHAESAITLSKEIHHHLEGDDFLAALTKENVISQLQHLRTHPCVATRLRAGKLQIHGWYYNIGEGTIEEYEESTGQFVPLDQFGIEDATDQSVLVA